MKKYFIQSAVVGLAGALFLTACCFRNRGDGSDKAGTPSAETKLAGADNRQQGDRPRVLITTPPKDIFVVEGGTATFVVGSKIPAVYWQWKFGEHVIVGATNSQLTVPNVSLNEVGLYTVVATVGGKKEEESEPVALFMLTTNSAGQPVTVQGPYRRYSTTATCDGSPVSVKGYMGALNPDNNTPWFPVGLSTGCTANTFDSVNHPYNTLLTSRERNNPGLPVPGCNDDASPPPPAPHPAMMSQLNFSVSGSQQYSFTLYTKGSPIPPNGYIMKINIIWSP